MARSQTEAVFSLQATAGLPICASSLTKCQTSLKYLSFHLTHSLSLYFLTVLSVCEKRLLRVENSFALSFKSNKFCLRREPLIPSVFSVCGDWVCWNDCLPLFCPCSLAWLDKDLTHVLCQSVAGENVHKLFDCYVLRKAVASETDHFPSFGEKGRKKILIEN